MKIWQISMADIKAFSNKDKLVFCGLLFGMIISSFVINYAYSFARYRGEIYSHSTGEDIIIYKIYSDEGINMSVIDKLISDLDLNEKKADITLFGSSLANIRVAGVTDLSNNLLGGIWTEGYYTKISPDDNNPCVINSELLSYNEKLKMIGESYRLDDFVCEIKGVFEPIGNKADIIIHTDLFRKLYKDTSEFWIQFDTPLSVEEESAFQEAIKNNIKHGTMILPEKDASGGDMITKSNQLQYSIFLILLVVFLALIIQYWYEKNTAVYTVYWMVGANAGDLLKIVACEIILLCVPTYVIGILLNVISRLFFNRNAEMMQKDFALGFGIYLGTILILSLINMYNIYRTSDLRNIRKD